MLQRSAVFSEVACTKEDDDKIVLDPNDIEGQLEFIKIIHEHGRLYVYESVN